ncbi:MAG: helix-turn-helix transcriptional regulator [Cyclobacteriaceae bacterium]
MVSIISTHKAQEKIAQDIRSIRLSKGLTQSGLADRSGVSLPTLRKFEQKGLISLESFLKLCMTLGCLEEVVNALESQSKGFSSIDEVLEDKKDKKPKRGWRK